MRKLNDKQQKKLTQANQLLGRGNSFDKQQSVGLIYHKLEMKMTDITKLMRDSLHNLEVAVSKKLTESKRRKSRYMRGQEKQSIAALEEEVFNVKEENVNLCL